jgi:ribonuclease P protein component
VRAQLSFAAADRLHRSAEFIRLQRAGVRFQSPHFVVYAGNLPGLQDGEPSRRSRLGVTVSRRVGIAVARNRVKRRVREIFRTVIRDSLPAGTSIVVIARAGAATLASAAIGDELIMAARNLGGRIGATGAFAGRN